MQIFYKNSFSKLSYLLGFIFLFSLIACKQRIIVPKDLNKEAFIPNPLRLEATGQSFEITEETNIYAPNEYDFVNSLAHDINLISEYNIKTLPYNSDPKIGNIYLQIEELKDENSEAYELNISPDFIFINANTESGLFYGIETLKQMMPPNIESGKVTKEKIYIASGKIIDSPRFAYRGAMLDVSRHFFDVNVVKRYIDYLAKFKMNRLHLHLTDDQGWRIEIKSWPKLTEVGGLTQVGGGKGGFFTQDDYKNIVSYAQSKFITMVPEIDMPGHTNAALVAYPELNCNKKDPNPKAYTGIDVGFSTLCTRNPEVYLFLDDVIKELSAITPGDYIHIGGDESHVTKIEDYIYFIDKVQKIVTKYNKKVLGWDDISSAKLEAESVVQHWAEKENVLKAIDQNAKVLMTPATKTYLDMQYDSTTPFGLHWAAYIELDSAYIWDPTTMIEGITEDQIIGVEAPLWTETVTNLDEIEYMAFPRLLGHAEIGWSSKTRRNWDEYKLRLAKHEARLTEMGIDFYKSELVPRELGKTKEK